MPAERRRAAAIALLLLGSGFCGLVYEISWLRLLRLVFGTSTAASAVALATFLGGLGFGGLLLGPRADRVRNPLRLYANLEMAVALAAAVSPPLILLVRWLYIALGGTPGLGAAGGMAVRLVLAALVLGLPAFLMGGTLPAAARAVQRAVDQGRRTVGVLYGPNTLGAVAGSIATTFVLLELLGTNLTVWVAALLNLAVALAARILAGRLPPPDAAPPDPGSHGWVAEHHGPEAGRRDAAAPGPAAPVALVLVAAAAVGFAFLLMELVWYRLLVPLLGGSLYTLGGVLSVALLGVGLGGLLYATGSERRRPTLTLFVWSCVLEALFLALPYALGDRLAVLAMALRPLGFVGFAPLVAVSLLVTVLVVFPAAVVAGYQFPLLVALLGSGGREVGRQVGLAYACNTMGAILGALAGGFGLLPLLSAPGVWRAVVFVLLALAAASVGAAARAGVPLRRGVAPVLVGLLGGWLCTAEGPTAFWRHAGIGAGQLRAQPAGPNELRSLLHDQRREILWAVDGVESTVALNRGDGDAFVVNGKNDGNAIADAPTQVMGGLLAALLHPNPRRVLVIGLGTGSTAGWLAQVPSVERVDVVELEPAIVRVAAACAPVNHDVLADPKVHVVIGDGREFLLAASAVYDVIFSEPSSLSRAGIASLFTREFYDAAARRLTDDGIFAQWLQTYEIGPPTVRTVYATLGAVFPSIETWQTQPGDLVLTARRRAQPHDLARLGPRVEREPVRSALAFTWGVQGVEGLYAAFVGADGLADALQRVAGTSLNTDDRTRIEFEIARTAGRERLFDPEELRALAVARGVDRPALVGGTIDWAEVVEQQTLRAVADGHAPTVPGASSPGFTHRVLARAAYVRGDLREAHARWLAQAEGPKGPMDVTMVAEILAAAGDPGAAAAIEALRAVQPVEAEALLALWHYGLQRPREAVEHLQAAFGAYGAFPWTHRFVLHRSFELVRRLSSEHPALAGALFDALAAPFAVHALDGRRLAAYFSIGLATDFAGRCAAALAPLEPHVPWDRRVLDERDRCYTLLKHPLAARARADLRAFVTAAPGPID
jgi:spermidine synthase